MIHRRSIPFHTVAVAAWLLLGACGDTSGDPVEEPNAPAHCSNGVKDDAETDLDCGGPCRGCGSGALCVTPSDCASAVCGNANRCLAVNCGDGTQAASEDGLDCGGVCPACLGGTCGADEDCQTGYCGGGVCAVPSCVDGVANGRETDLDCGGGDCPACGTDSACIADVNCATGICRDRVCRDPSCDDGLLNQDESAIDCGGICAGCAYGVTCSDGDDCDSGRCEAGACVCADPRFTGAACDQCADPTYAPPTCSNCSDPRFTGDDCDQCADPTLLAPECVDCVATHHRCSDGCVPNDSVNSCGERCDPCPVPEHAAATTCDGGVCAFTCSTGYHQCGDACVSDVDVTTCGDRCAPCEGPADSELGCTAGECTFTCNSGFHLCDGACADDTSVATCGDRCAPCRTVADGEARCVTGECRVVCDDDRLGPNCGAPATASIASADSADDVSAIAVDAAGTRYAVVELDDQVTLLSRTAGGSWSSDVVATSSKLRDYASDPLGVVVDDAGDLFVFHPAESTSLHVSTRTDSGWEATALAGIGFSRAQAFAYSSGAIDVFGKSSDGTALNHYRGTVGAWTTTELEPLTGDDTTGAVAVAVHDRTTLHIVYSFSDAGANRVRYRTLTADGWQTTDVATTDKTIVFTQIAVGADGQPHIAWGEKHLGDGFGVMQLHHAALGAQGWALSPVPDLTFTAGNSPAALAVDATGLPHLLLGSMRPEGQDSVAAYLRWNGLAWESRAVLGDEAEGVALRLSPTGAVEGLLAVSSSWASQPHGVYGLDAP